METKNEFLEIKDLSVCYHAYDEVVKAVNHVSLSLEKGETLGLVGETGAGKTTTALSIMRLLPKRTGEVLNGEIIFNGQNLLSLPEKDMFEIRGSQIAMIFQDPMTALNPLQRVGEQIAEVISLHRDQSKEETEKTVDEIMKSVGLPPDRKDEYPHQFSGGMKQRIVIAIALACNPSLLIADEPTTALDVTIQAQILHLMQNLIKDFDTSILFITHDLGVVAEMADRVVVMYTGQIVEEADVYTLFHNPKHPYTQGLLNSTINVQQQEDELEPIAGTVPSLSNLPKGCRFHPRCKYATEACRNTMPSLVEVAPGHYSRCLLAEKEG